MSGSTPSLTDFKPYPKQLKVIKDIRKKFNYLKGVHEVMLSGSVGSSKSLMIAHIAITHCLMYEKSSFGIGRLALPQLKNTLCVKIKEHLYGSGLRQNIDYFYNQTTGSFKFSNGSTMPALTWQEGNMEKLGSYEFSGFAIEELTETKTSHAYNTLKQRVGRLPHVPEQILISATNPSSPSHWAYERIIQKSENNDLIHVYYSTTFENPYLPKSYTDNLISTLDAKMVRRMVYGEWIEITTEVIYYSYDKAYNYIDKSYEVDPRLPIIICWDFNIGIGKPLSVAFLQYDGKKFHAFNEIVIEGQRTEEACEEMLGKGLLDYNSQYLIMGDATGRARNTRSKSSDYDIIDNFFSNNKNSKKNIIRYKIMVPRSNPPIRTRHNIVNGVICNGLGERNFLVYKDAPTIDKGLRLTKLRKGSSYIEDDSDWWQHITTACGYGICRTLSETKKSNASIDNY